MYLLFLILILIASILMCFIVLIQNSKGGGLASGFASSNQIMGVRKTTDLLEKTTWGLAIAMVILSVATAYVLPSTTETGSVIMQDAVKNDKTNPENLPDFGTNKAPASTPAQAPAKQAPAQAPAK